jgi:DNA-binding transcriptional LysR family regulator
VVGYRRLPVDVRLLESFTILAEELHFTRAAARLHIAQPALSQQIARLERQLGVRLFTRPPGPVVLTTAGGVLLREARPALLALHAAVVATMDVAAGASGRLRLCHLSSYGPQVVPALAAAMRDVAPDVVLQVSEASIEEQLDGIRSRAVDVGLFHLDPAVSIDDAGIVTELIASTPRYVVLPPQHALARAQTVDLATLAGETWILPVGSATASLQAANFLESCRRHGFEPTVGQQANSIETMLGLVASGFGVAPAPWPVALRPPPGLALVRVEGDHHDFVVAYAAHATTGTALRSSFVLATRRVVEELVGQLDG